MAAGTIQVSTSFSVTKDGVTVSGSYNSGNLTMAGTEFVGNAQTIGTASEALVLGDITTIGFVMVKNLDPTNFVQISLDNSQVNLVAKLLPGEATIFKPGTTTLYGKADTAACSCFVGAAEL
jgi:hypothetical protein